MATPTTNPQAASVEPSAKELRTYTFSPFKLTPANLPCDAKASARELCNLVDHVTDVVSGAALVFELQSAHDCDIDSDNQSYLSPYYLGLLQRMAVRSLVSLGERAEDIATNLHNDFHLASANGEKLSSVWRGGHNTQAKDQS